MQGKLTGTAGLEKEEWKEQYKSDYSRYVLVDLEESAQDLGQLHLVRICPPVTDENIPGPPQFCTIDRVSEAAFYSIGRILSYLT